MPVSHHPQPPFRTTLDGTGGRVYVRLPFDPASVWGSRDRYYITGTINSVPVRGPLERSSLGTFLPLGPAWRRDAGLKAGDAVSVQLALEGPQREALAADIEAALAVEPESARAFDALATFYRKAWLRWIDATKRRPEVRVTRIAEMVASLKAGRKQPPQ